MEITSYPTFLPSGTTPIMNPLDSSSTQVEPPNTLDEPSNTSDEPSKLLVITDKMRKVVCDHFKERDKNTKLKMNDANIRLFLTTGQPLHYAASRSYNTELVKMLLELNYDYNSVNTFGENPLLLAHKAFEIAIRGGRSQKEIDNKVAIINLFPPMKSNILCANRRGIRPLDLMVKNDLLVYSKLLEELHAYSPEQLNEAESLLHYLHSYDANAETVIDFFISRGISIDNLIKMEENLDKEKKSPLTRALERGDLKLARFFIEKGATLPSYFCRKEIAKLQDIKLVLDLVKLDIDPYGLDKEGKSILMHACEEFVIDDSIRTKPKHKKFISGLVDMGFCITQKSNEQISPLHLLVRNQLFRSAWILETLKKLPIEEIKDAADIIHHTDNTLIIGFFLTNKVSLDSLDYAGKPPLWYAIIRACNQNGELKTIELLLKGGASPKIELPCLHIARSRNMRFISALKKLGFDIFQRDYLKNDILAYACEENPLNEDDVMLELFLSSLVDLGFPTIVKNCKVSPLFRIVKEKLFNTKEIIDILKKIEVYEIPPNMLRQAETVYIVESFMMNIMKISLDRVFPKEFQVPESLFSEEFKIAAQLLHHTTNEDVVMFFIKAGISIDLFDATGKTPLYLAVERLDINFIMFLLRNGADPNLLQLETPKCREGNNFTPLELIEMKIRDLTELTSSQNPNVVPRKQVGSTQLPFKFKKNNSYAQQLETCLDIRTLLNTPDEIYSWETQSSDEEINTLEAQSTDDEINTLNAENSDKS